jgi:RNA polymerase sigma-70 factor (ECF subfamily)
MNNQSSADKELDLMLKVKQGDQTAFEELYHLYKIPLGNFFYRLSNNRGITEDCLQEVFYHIWSARGSYQPRSKAITYIFQIAKNYWINEGKRLKRKPVPFTSIAGPESNNSALNLNNNQRKPDEELISKELKETVNNAINRLPENERLVLVMSQYQGLKYLEIAEILDIAEITVKTRMAKALERLKKYLSKYLQ